MTKVHIEQTPSEKIVSKKLPKNEVTDDLGRKIKLKMPDLLDQFDLRMAFPDNPNAESLAMASGLLYIASIDDVPFNTPRTFTEIRAGIKKVGDSGMMAILGVINELAQSQSNEVSDIKK